MALPAQAAPSSLANASHGGTTALRVRRRGSDANRQTHAFATVRHRTKMTKVPGPTAAGLAMAFTLIESAQARWRAINAPRRVALVRAGATFINGQLAERPDAQAPPTAA